MARTGTSWPVLVTLIAAAVVAVGSLVGVGVLREQRSADQEPPRISTPPRTEAPAVCPKQRCRVVDTQSVGATTVELVADQGADQQEGRPARSALLRIGGGGASAVIEVTVTDLGVDLTDDSLQCVAASLSACLVRGKVAGSPGEIAGEVVVGRSGQWNRRDLAYVSDAGYLELAAAASNSTVHVVAVQYDCDHAVTKDCSGQPVFAQVFDVGRDEVGCTTSVSVPELLPGYPRIHPERGQLEPCAKVN